MDESVSEPNNAAAEIEEAIRRQVLAERAAFEAAAHRSVDRGSAVRVSSPPARKSPLNSILITVVSMIVAIVIGGRVYGMRFAIWFVLAIFIHEMGHVVAILMRGKRPESMVFLPMFGAFVTRRASSDPVENAFIAIMGPVAGALAGLAFLIPYGVTHDHFWLELGYADLVINLLNLIPMSPLDGSKVVPLFAKPKPRPAMVAPGYAPMPDQPWNMAPTPAAPVDRSDRPEVAASTRIRYQFAYYGLIIALVILVIILRVLGA